MGIKEEGVQTKSIRSIFNKIIAKNSPNLQKEMLIQVQETCRTPNRQDQNTISPWHIIVKTLSTENKERLFKVAKDKCQVIYKGKPNRIAADFSRDTLEKEGMEWRHFKC
jgi:hypothetical protein